jgi:hypothetical protein
MSVELVEYKLGFSYDKKPFDELLEQVNRTHSKFNRLKNSLVDLGQISFGIRAIADGINAVKSKIDAFENAYNAQIEVESKLATVMRNTIGASDEEIQHIKDLAAAQQALGVVGDEVQLAGAQELATYVGQTKSLDKLIPVMNDMIAQQYGLNATQESAVGIATMMGKVMDGQVGALSRYGYKFDDAQEKILKFGTEEQRAAVLAKVVSSSVGGVNAALAETPAGRMKQMADTWGDLQEEIGRVIVAVRSALAPVFERVIAISQRLVAYIEANIDTITAVVSEVADAIGTAIDDAVEFAPVILTVVGAIMAIVTAIKIWTVVQTILNVVMSANPIALIIIGVAALISIIYTLCTRVKDWGSLWGGVCDFMKYQFLTAVSFIKLEITSLVNLFMMAIDKIKIGWYKFKEAMGLGDSQENQAAIQQIQADVEKRKQAIIDSAKEVMDNSKKAIDSLKAGWKTATKMGDGKKSTNDSLLSAVNSGGSQGTLDGATAKKTEAVATGGKRSTTVNITLGNMIETVNFNGSASENQTEIERTFAESLSRVLGMAAVS